MSLLRNMNLLKHLLVSIPI